MTGLSRNVLNILIKRATIIRENESKNRSSEKDFQWQKKEDLLFNHFFPIGFITICDNPFCWTHNKEQNGICLDMYPLIIRSFKMTDGNCCLREKNTFTRQLILVAIEFLKTLINHAASNDMFSPCTFIKKG